MKRAMKAQVCEANKALLSFRKVTKARNRVVFGEDTGCIEDVKTGEKMWLTAKDGVYVLETKVAPTKW